MKTQLAKEYRARYGSDMPNLKLARIMYNENNLLFSSVEDARKYVRYIEGKTINSGPKKKNLPTYARQTSKPIQTAR